MDLVQLKTRQSGFVRLFQSAPIVQHFGMKLHYNEANSAVVDLPFNPKLDHALFQTHGGAIATLLDTTGWFTVAPYFEHWIATVEFSTRLLEPVEKQDLRGVSRILRRGKRLVIAEMQVESQAGKLIAVGSGTFTVTGVLLQLP